jgi:peptidoglycan-associated lipoprotein
MGVVEVRLLAAAAVSLTFLFTVACGTSNLELRVHRPAMPVVREKVPPITTKTDICPECADRLKPEAVKAEAPVPPSKQVPELADIYFSYDRYEIRPRDQEILRKNAEWFTAFPGKRARIEGHCDERGTTVYNIGLGQKRAEAARTYLMDVGVEGERLEAVGRGRENPSDPGHNGEAWARNRRAHFVPLD